MTEPAFELSLDDVGEHITDLRRAAYQGNVVYLTDRGQRLATVIPFPSPETSQSGSSRLAGFIGTLPGFEHDVDVESSRNSWERN